MKIREAKLSDKSQLQYICAKTATDRRFQDNQELVSLLYLDYYIDHQTNHCFVIADEQDIAVGYILCDTNYLTYKKAIKPYIQKVKHISFIDYIGHIAESVYLDKIYKKYPTHMHIDILPEYQGQGFGKQLILRLIEHLKQENIHSLRLTVGANNVNAVGFYNHLGFKQKKNIFNNALILVKFF